MRLVALMSFFLVFFLIIKLSLAQVQYYDIIAVLDQNGRAYINSTITFSKPLATFAFDVFGEVENIQVSSNAGPVDCKLSFPRINCSLTLTEEKREVKIYFKTSDFVKKIDDRFYFNGDFSLNKDIDLLNIYVRLPEGMALVGQTTSFPENSTTLSDGRRIIVIWKLDNLRFDQSLKFQILYEQIQSPPLFKLRLRHFAIFGVAMAMALSFIYLRYFRNPEKLVLSVLDDYERKVMNVVVAAKEGVNQKKVVQETNLSKAKVSRVVKALADRGIIVVERLGRTNKLRVVRKKFKLF